MANFEEMDHEWIELIKEAKDLGISIQELKEFFSKNCEKLTSKEETLSPIGHIPL